MRRIDLTVKSMRCEECIKSSKSSGAKRVHFCALCGCLRCEDHSIWVPSHRLSAIPEISKLLMTKPVDGWYAFCGRHAHVPKGVSTWSGRGRKEGTVVEEVLPTRKIEGLEQFPMWETGTVKGGFERHRDPHDYRLSCAFVSVMNLILQLYRTGRKRSDFLSRIHLLIFESVASKKPLFYSVTNEAFHRALGNEPSLEELLSFACSRCGVVVCLNRQAPFFDRPTFEQLARFPDSAPFDGDINSKSYQPLHPVQ